MSIVVFEHHPQEPAALLGSTLLNCGHRLHVVRLHAGDAMPVDLDDVEGVISMGGPMNVGDAEHAWMEPQMAYLRAAHERGLPVVGVCLGAQLIAAALGGKVEPMPTPEVGWQPVRLTFPGTTDAIFAGIPWRSMQFHMHGRQITQPPAGAVPLASSQACPTQAFRVGTRTYGFQYHFEWDEHTLGLVANDPLVAAAGQTSEAITQGIAEHFDLYRHLGNRLCENLALMLFPAAVRV